MRKNDLVITPFASQLNSRTRLFIMTRPGTIYPVFQLPRQPRPETKIPAANPKVAGEWSNAEFGDKVDFTKSTSMSGLRN
ncbi:hypothetical protein MKX08_008360 [Trichoderma sp. CBMAI-0020]|nr:hypothetical protein MKX08_008360 [Trichoderma sp. CBMAI-0020]